jgi:hypothetical protein
LTLRRYRRPWRSMKGSEGTPISSLVLWVEVLEMEPLVTSIGWPCGRGPGEVAVVELAERVLPRASVVVKSHCFASAVLGRMGGLVTLPPE